MTDRTVNLLENGRLVSRGISHGRGRIYASQAEDESLTYTFDFATWLGSADAIDTAETESVNCTAEAIVDDDTTVTLTLSAFKGGGYAKLKITTDDDLVKELTIYTQTINGGWANDYGECA